MQIVAIGVSGTALSATIPENTEEIHVVEHSGERNPLHYQLATLPLTNKKRVEALCPKFLSLIPKAMLMPLTIDRTVYRLVVTPFDTIESAKKYQAELSLQCKSPFVIKSNSGYSVVASSLLTETSALEEQKRLARKNISTTLLEVRVPLKHWQMKSANGFNIRDAVMLASKLARIGVTTTIEPRAPADTLP